LKEATETLDGCTAQRVRAEGDLAITKKQLSENRNFLATVEETRRREAYAFETATEVYQATSKALDDALVILEEIWSGESSFADLTRHTNKLLKSAVKIRKAHLMAPLMSALAQLASKDLQADDGLLDRVRTMLQNFRSKIETEYNDTAAAEQQAIELFNSQKAKLETTIDNLANQKDGLEQELQSLDKCIITQQGIVSSASAKRDRNQRLWDDAAALCNSVEEEYKSASSARKQELELLAAIRERVEARFAQLSTGVKDRGTQDEFTYSNDYAYEQPQFAASS